MDSLTYNNSISEIADLLVSFHTTTPTKGHTEWSKKEKLTNEQQFSEK